MTLVKPDLSVLAEPATVVVTSGTSVANSLRGEAGGGNKDRTILCI